MLLFCQVFKEPRMCMFYNMKSEFWCGAFHLTSLWKWGNSNVHFQADQIHFHVSRVRSLTSTLFNEIHRASQILLFNPWERGSFYLWVLPLCTLGPILQEESHNFNRGVKCSQDPCLFSHRCKTCNGDHPSYCHDESTSKTRSQSQQKKSANRWILPVSKAQKPC